MFLSFTMKLMKTNILLNLKIVKKLKNKRNMKNLIIEEKLFEIKVKKETIDKDIQTDKEDFEQLTVLEKCQVNKSVYENKLEEIK